MKILSYIVFNYLTGKRGEDDVSPMPTARIPKSYQAPEVEKHSDSTSEGRFFYLR